MLLGAAFVVLALGAVQLLDGMQDWTDLVSGAAPGLRSNLFAAEAVGAGRIDPDLVLPLSYVPVTAGGYLGAVADVGSPIEGEDPAGFGGRPDQRRTADELLVEQLPITAVEPVRGGSGCGTPAPDAAVLDAVAPGSTVYLAPQSAPGPPQVRISRFLDEPAVSVPVGPDGNALSIPADAAGRGRCRVRPARTGWRSSAPTSWACAPPTGNRGPHRHERSISTRRSAVTPQPSPSARVRQAGSTRDSTNRKLA